MPFRPDPFLRRVEPLRRWQQRPPIGYSVAFLVVAAAAGLRLAIGPVMNGIPFMVFYPAIAIATAVGGARPGLVSILLSVVAANYMLNVPDVGFATDSTSLIVSALFIPISALIVGQIMLLNIAVDRLSRQADRGSAILESQPSGIIAIDQHGRITLVNSAVERQFGYSRDELIGQPVEMLVPTELRQGHDASRTAFMGAPSTRLMGAGRDLHAMAKDGSLLPVEIGLNPVTHGGRTGTLATIVDISERKSLEWRAQVLAKEVQHRSRNLLTIVQALAQRILPRDEGARFASVLAAIARTQELFGTASTGSLRGIVEAELAPFRDQCDISECDLMVDARIGQDLALIIHELATNALKYGALSTKAGRVSVDCAAENGTFRLCWVESNGPPVTAPAREGLGKTILRDLPQAFADAVSLDYSGQGFRYELAARTDRIASLESEEHGPKQ